MIRFIFWRKCMKKTKIICTMGPKDVYKRQAFSWPRSAEEALEISSEQYAMFMQGPVSYTHLDVYKRQVYCDCLKYPLKHISAPFSF